MSIQATVKINKSLDKKLALLQQSAEDIVRDKLVDIAQTAVTASPVDTGAYVTSHSFQTNTSSRGRGKSSANKPRGQDPQAMRQEGLNNLVQDINQLDLSNISKITLRNDSPHAQAVEHKHGYYVYAQVRNIHG
ncbi:hypothetical protein GWO13_09465 [Candidatus Bathyarchaeota archaeon]|nr:hypothetical protein [Candidatus Bathyarchaeota archaeon]